MRSLATISVEERPLARDVQRLANNLVRLQISEETSGQTTIVGGYNSIWVVVDMLTKSVNFIPVQVNYTAERYSVIYEYNFLSFDIRSVKVDGLIQYVPDESLMLVLDSVELGPDISFEEEPIIILDRHVRKLRIKAVKV
ncbi:hypothetical protein MTR67_039888 [Solanum verrucosum]|uniref:Uncharacterized protein n=1 Tax=Solanum verrucosum TaxID=315347 RepID=A0AAF0ZQV4_SOLVR|nr:hypothetical protein MTR67_039888 [Solanum verrucosum]